MSLYHLITVDDNLDHLVNVAFVRFLYNIVVIFLYIGENTLRLCKYPGLLKLLSFVFTTQSWTLPASGITVVL